MEDQLALLLEVPEINCFDDIITDQDIAAVLQGMDMNSHHNHLQPYQSLSSSTDSSATATVTAATNTRPSRQPKLRNSSSSPPCLPVILNFGSASSMPEDDSRQGNVATMDKSSVLGEAIKHIKQLQERVKTLEEDSGRKMVESVVLVKKSQVALEDDDFSSSGDNVNEVPPKNNNCQDEDHFSGIDVRVWKNDLLLKLQCDRQEAILPRILSALEKHRLRISTVHATPFGDKTFDITIIAQMDEEVKPQNVVGDLYSVIKGS
ncbi:hypothetical protein Cgig2_007241 [Carnegiea gigantea]|uniref:Plant bHLH transcription factor ACT-like domain-containing protein n=1 Tax=Carnegiea gigantea TaxID=171969 RepID=A0A9Q1KZI3_9CARY|nr:hypothetical protein Cgig2_007241 [Carnegiea gigantea]